MVREAQSDLIQQTLHTICKAETINSAQVRLCTDWMLGPSYPQLEGWNIGLCMSACMRLSCMRLSYMCLKGQVELHFSGKWLGWAH